MYKIHYKSQICIVTRSCNLFAATKNILEQHARLLLHVVMFENILENTANIKIDYIVQPIDQSIFDCKVMCSV